MSGFIETSEGLVNARHVASIKAAVVGNALLLYDGQGHVIGRLDYGPGYIENIKSDLLGTILPATVPMFAVVMHHLHSREDKRPAAEDIDVERLPIIGWRVNAQEAEPILPGARYCQAFSEYRRFSSSFQTGG
jgi:hypothetical protein